MGEPLNTSESLSFMSKTQSSTHTQDYPGSMLSVNQSDGPFTYFVGKRTRNGRQNPLWRSQIRNGQNATTTFIGSDFEGHVDFFTAIQDCTFIANDGPDFHHRGLETYGYLSYSSMPSVGLPAAVSNRVLNRCIKRFIETCQSAQSAFEGGQDIGEYKETLNSINRPLGGMQDKMKSYLESLKKAKSRYRKSPLSLPKVLADTYLEFRFGINPLVADVSQLIADAARTRFSTIPVKSHASEEYTASNTIGSFASNTGRGPSMQTSKLQKSKYSLRYMGAIKPETLGNGQIALASQLRLWPQDWLPTAWDLLPWSWVADYFSNVGDIISALSFVSSNLLWGCKTDKSECSITYTIVRFQNPISLPANYHWGSHTETWQGGNAIFKAKDVTRSALVGSDLMPVVTFKVPTSPYPYLNLASVLVSRAGGIVPLFNSIKDIPANLRGLRYGI